jgi:hypothetical protein
MTSRRTQLTAAAERPGTGVITGIAGVGIDELFFPASGQRVPLGLQFAQQLRQRPRFGGRCQCRPQGLLHAGFPAKGHESVKLVFGNTGNDNGPGKIRSHACAAPIRQGDQVGKGGLLMGFVGPEKADMVNAGHLEDTHEFILSRSGESAEQQLGGPYIRVSECWTFSKVPSVIVHLHMQRRRFSPPGGQAARGLGQRLRIRRVSLTNAQLHLAGQGVKSVLFRQWPGHSGPPVFRVR